MTDFDKSAFEHLMGQSVQLQHEGKYEEALEANIEAYNHAPEDSFEKGRAARDAAARLDRLGHPEEAESFAIEGLEIHNRLFVEMGGEPSREAYRERSVSAMFVGVIGLRKAIQAQQAGETVRETDFIGHLRSTLEDLKDANARAKGVNRIVDQYQINATRRVSIGESLFGERKKGTLLGLKAVASAFMSESPRIDTANPNLTFKERLPIKKKALLGGIAAIGVNVLASPHENKRRQFAHTLANRTL